MYSLFWKIFLWFWVATIVMGGAIAWATAQVGRERIPLMIEHEKEEFARNVDRAEGVLRTQGVPGLRAWLNEPDHTIGMRIYVLDPAGNEMLGKAVPPQLMRLLPMFNMGEYPNRVPNPRAESPVPELPGFHVEVPPMRGLIVHPVAVPGEGYFYLVGIFRPPHPLWHLVSIPGLLIAVLISGLVCLGLARHLSAPVRRLRAATQAFAAGDLAVRVAAMPGPAPRDEFGGLYRDFDSMAERLQALVESQQRLLRDVSHELRSPLARLQAALGLARQRTDGRAAEELDRIEREAERLNELIGQVLSLARLAAVPGDGRQEPVDLDPLVQAIARDAEFEAVQRRRHVAVRECAAAVVTGNPELLHSAIENVVRNAVHYTEEGTTVEIALRRDAGQAVIQVRDRGPGIVPAAMSKIFDPFFRANEARDRASGGYGLGLAIAKRAIELHGGGIAADNHPGGGLELTLRLPLAQREAPRDRGDKVA
jgi:two-component system sensor histidine kinase CpxA